MNNTVLDSLKVGIDTSAQPTFTCSDQVTWIGAVADFLPSDSYELTAGITAFPTSNLTQEQAAQIRHRPLVLAQVC